jgi:hypothetical protein
VIIGNKNLHQVKQEVLRAVNASDRPYPPGQLIQGLKQAGFDENAIRAAMWDLIDHRQVHVTGDLKLTKR